MRIKGTHLMVLVAMCGLLASGIGLVTNVSGLFFTPIAEEFGIARGAVSLTLTICNISLALGGLLVPRLLSERTLKPMLIGATAVLAGSTAALALCPSAMPMYLLCVLRGFAAGLITFVFATTILNKWFVANIGLATSIAMGCSGIAGALFSPVVNGIIGVAGWRVGFVVLGLLTVGLNLPAILFVPCVDPTTRGMVALGASTRPAQGKARNARSAQSTKAQPINRTVFLAVIGYALFASAATALPQHFPGLAENYALDAAVGAMMISASMVSNTLGKVLLGALIDKFGTKVSVLLYSVLVTIASVALLFVRAPFAMMVSATLFGLCYALGTVGISMVTRDAFGLENYGKTYPTINLVGNMANAVFSTVVGVMYDLSGGYVLALVMYVIMLIAVIFIVLFVYGGRPQGIQMRR